MLENFDCFISGVGFRLTSLKRHVRLTSTNQFDNRSIGYKRNCEIMKLYHKVTKQGLGS